MSQLQFSDTTNKAGLLQACERKVFNSDYGRITGDATLKLDFTARLNEGRSWVEELIMKSDTRWQWDDTNHPDYPIYTETMVDDQHDYQLETEHIKILRVGVANADGDISWLTPIDPRDAEMPLEEIYDTKGMPRFYDKRANSIFLYPAPSSTDTTLSEGLKLWAQRTGDVFSSNDITQTPGFPSLFHQAVADYASWGYAEDNGMADKAERLARRLYGGGTVEGWTEKITGYYSRRDVDDKPRLGVNSVRRLTKLH